MDMETEVPASAAPTKIPSSPNTRSQEDDRPSKIRKLVHESESDVATTVASETPQSQDISDTTQSQDQSQDFQPKHQQYGSTSRKSISDLVEAAGIPLVDSEGTPLTKSAIKRIWKKLEWESKADDRLARRRDEKQRKKDRKHEEKKNLKKQTGLSGENGTAGEVPSVTTFVPRHTSLQVPITIIIDCSYSELMTEKELKSLGSQITRCYSDNHRTAPYHVHLAVSSWGGPLRARFENELGRQHDNWKGVRFFEEDFEEVSRMSKEWMHGPDGGEVAGALSDNFVIPASSVVPREVSERVIDDPEGAHGETVYFSSDSKRTMARLQPYGTYVIGGLVDRNRHKGVCHRKAISKGMATGQLPIGEFLKLSCVNVLATNHVSEIALRWLEMGNWADAFLRVMPKRKGGQLLDHLGQQVAKQGENSKDGDDGNLEAEDDYEEEAEEEEVNETSLTTAS